MKTIRPGPLSVEAAATLNKALETMFAIQTLSVVPPLELLGNVLSVGEAGVEVIQKTATLTPDNYYLATRLRYNTGSTVWEDQGGVKLLVPPAEHHLGRYAGLSDDATPVYVSSAAAGGGGGDVPDASLTVRGVVNLASFQHLGAGNKAVNSLTISSVEPSLYTDPTYTSGFNYVQPISLGPGVKSGVGLIGPHPGNIPGGLVVRSLVVGSEGGNTGGNGVWCVSYSAELVSNVVVLNYSLDCSIGSKSRLGTAVRIAGSYSDAGVEVPPLLSSSGTAPVLTDWINLQVAGRVTTQGPYRIWDDDGGPILRTGLTTTSAGLSFCGGILTDGFIVVDGGEW